jgi:small subunit ribosomal protein S8
MDNISDIILRIKNANWSKKQTVTFPYSLMAMEIAEVLIKNGFLGSASRKGKKVRTIEATLLYDNNEQPKISGVKRVSKQSKRVYLGVKDLKSVRNSYGKAIVSTPRGIMTGDDAKQAKVGGELLFQIW